MPTEPIITDATPIPPTLLDYAPVVKGRGLRRWLARLLVVLVIVATAVLSWYGWQWRLKQDEKAFNAQASIGPSKRWVQFNARPATGQNGPSAAKVCTDGFIVE